MPDVRVTRTYLALDGRDALRRPERAPDVDDARVALVRLDPVDPARYLALYRAVGERWHWRDRLAWSDTRLAEHLARPATQVWLLTVDGEDAGWFELDVGEREVEIVYFGLLPAFTGRGLGGALLVRAVEVAWAAGAERVWLHTCTLDGPAALPNYRARGFVPWVTEAYVATLPDDEGGADA